METRLYIYGSLGAMKVYSEDMEAIPGAMKAHPGYVEALPGTMEVSMELKKLIR
jgi:hypothetical protein